MGLGLRRLRLLIRSRPRSLGWRGLTGRLRVDGLSRLLLRCLVWRLLRLRLGLLRLTLRLTLLLLLLMLGLLLSLLLLLLLSLLLLGLLLGLLLLLCLLLLLLLLGLHRSSHLGLLELHVLRVHLDRLALLLALLHLLVLDGLVLLERNLLGEHCLCLRVVSLLPARVSVLTRANVQRCDIYRSHALAHCRKLSRVHGVHLHAHGHSIDASHIRVKGLLRHERLPCLLLLLE